MASKQTLGKLLWNGLQEHLQAVDLGPGSDPEIPVVWGVRANSTFASGVKPASAIASARKVLLESHRVYRWEDNLVLETPEDDPQLLILCGRASVDPLASSLLAGLFSVGIRNPDGPSAFALPPPRFVSCLLMDTSLWEKARRIRHHARRPVFDDEFVLRGPGWHDGPGILVHGEDIVPVLPVPAQPGVRALERLPPHVRNLFAGFCFAGDADLTNAVALLLTGFLGNLFASVPHPIGLFNGNQPGLGKTLLAQSISVVLDGVEPTRLKLDSDEELQKVLAGLLRDARCSVLLLDNVRTHINSTLLEQNVLSPSMTFRLLGGNVMITRPNSYLWLVTGNNTSATCDLINRGLPVQFYHEGDPTGRNFSDNPLDHARRHRKEILGELAGMVLNWVNKGKPEGAARHRCEVWARTVGGILEANGLDHLLANAGEAQVTMDPELQELATLADYLLGDTSPNSAGLIGSAGRVAGMAPGEWAPFFAAAGVCKDRLYGRNTRGQHTIVGNFLSGKVDRSVEVSDKRGRTGVATLRVKQTAKKKLYYFELAMNVGEQPPLGPGVLPHHSPEGTQDGFGTPPPLPVPSTTPAVDHGGEPGSEDELQWVP